MTEQWHFSGIGGAGMNPLARLMAARGYSVQGSDRDFDRGHNDLVRKLLQDAGIQLVAQDGEGVHDGLERLIHSAAVEPTVPEMQRAADLGVVRQSRPALLAELLNTARPGVAIAGTSGKSTVTGMLAWICQRCGVATSVLGGAALAEAGARHMGCFAAAGANDPLIAEACESDGTLVGYHPEIGAVLNISRDHHELEALGEQFATFAAQCGVCWYPSGDVFTADLLADLPQGKMVGAEAHADCWAYCDSAGPHRARGRIRWNASADGVGGALVIDRNEEYELVVPQPGRYQFDNAAMACALAVELGVSLADAVNAMAEFPGVARRFQLAGVSDSGIRVIDDYAHNGAKIAAVVQAAQLQSDRLLIVFQPHGFAPARFLQPELRRLWPSILRSQDRLCYSEIYYAGGSVNTDMSSERLARDLPPDMRCGFAPLIIKPCCIGYPMKQVPVIPYLF